MIEIKPNILTQLFFWLADIVSFIRKKKKITAFTFYWGVVYRQKHPHLWLRLHEMKHVIDMKTEGLFNYSIRVIKGFFKHEEHDSRPVEKEANDFATFHQVQFRFHNFNRGVTEDEFLKEVYEQETTKAA